ILFKTTVKIAIGCIFLFAIGCRRTIPKVNVPLELKKAMLSYLKKQPNYDSTRVRFEVRDVYYYADTNLYRCEFKVHMVVPSRNVDTTGMMDGTVSKDFKTVHRTD
ncbi:MAG TPA: hypothetical protein VKU83_06750, partial [Puia sp.]|nr:hypothetical protein [Puia sp.]